MPKIIENKQTNPKSCLNEIIKERDIPLSDIVENTKISQSSLSMLLTGKRTIRLVQLIELANYLDVSMDYLLYRDEFL